ncbi:hypothetical protein [Parabacteroides sp. PF5-9]|uniref:hypothetical protein n=1 Tax=Parabacteroides sp. PF5-9 TaxID=1742404 RepID=UPI002473F8D6|nr:hypothetical protein [Parabacteroides sp. PF5-9]MDH6357628.1 hypothetical protein [Parabacteroides sp. PF5-9]
MITLELYELKNISMEMAELGVASYVKRIKPTTDQISQREAYRLYGEAKIKNWVKQGLIKEVKRSGSTIRSKILYSRSELIGIEVAYKLDSIINR